MFLRGHKKKDKLSQSVSCAGCAAKLSPVLLRQALSELPKGPRDPRLLVGFDKADDAAVYYLNDKQTLIQTLDFFTPIVDDPIWFGRIAAANALSDIYAMGGSPVTALNIFCYPEEMGSEVMGQILKGGQEKIVESGAILAGGHSVKDKEIKYGLSVTGFGNPERIFSNDKLLPGQVLVLTKKLGTGIITTANKNEECPEDVLLQAMQQMATLNAHAARAMLMTKATAATDITGFGFLGHLSEMARASGVNINIQSKGIPVLDGAFDLVADGFITGATKANRAYAGNVEFAYGVNEHIQQILLDPQTSGGLLIAMPTEDVLQFKKLFKDLSGGESWVVGEVMAKSESPTLIVQ